MPHNQAYLEAEKKIEEALKLNKKGTSLILCLRWGVEESNLTR